VWFCLSCSLPSSPRHSFLDKPTVLARTAVLYFPIMNSVTDTTDNDAVERTRVNLVRFRLSYVRPSSLSSPVRVFQARWTRQHDNKRRPPTRSFPLPKHLRLFHLFHSCPLRRSLPRFTNLLRPAWCTSHPIFCSALKAELAPPPAFLRFNPSRVCRLDGCLGGQPPSLRLRRQHQPWGQGLRPTKGPVGSRRKVGPQRVFQGRDPRHRYPRAFYQEVRILCVALLDYKSNSIVDHPL